MNTILTMMLSALILIAGFVTVSGIPAMMIVTGYRKNQYWLVALSVAVAALFTVFINVMAGLSALLVLLPFAYVILYCMLQKISFFRAVLIAMFTLILAVVAVGFIVYRYTDGGITEWLRQYAESLAPVMKEYASGLYADMDDAAAVEMTVSMLLNTVPALIVCTSFSVSLMTYSFAASYINKKCDNKVVYRKFAFWEPPATFGCAMLIALMLLFVLVTLDVEWADPVVELVFSSYVLMLTIKGASCFFFYQKIHKMPDIPAWAIMVILSAAAPVLFTAIGFFDGIFRLRFAYMVKHGMVVLKKPVNPGNKNDNNGNDNTTGGFSMIFDDNEDIIDDEERKSSEEKQEEPEREDTQDEKNKNDDENNGSGQ